jgi:ribosomal-protein-alanine N-acetyltransferase
MVARPPVKVLIEPMGLDDLEAVHHIELASFSSPWPPNAYRSELETNRLASYLVARVDGDIVAYGGMWLMVDEAHITTFAVHPAWRRQRIGERLLLAFLDLAVARHAREATLEVRLSNISARRLYEKYGFRPVGLRPRYYSDDGEDALIMTTEPITDTRYRDRIAALRSSLDAAPAPTRPEERAEAGAPGPQPTPEPPGQQVSDRSPDAGGREEPS